MEAVECGAAALAIVLAYHGRWVPLEELRVACGVSRDGSRASGIARAAGGYGLIVTGFRKEPEELRALPLPQIVFWNFNHFVVVEGFGRNEVYVNDPATGPRTVTIEELDAAFTGVVLVCEPGPDFRKGGTKPGLLAALSRRLAGSVASVVYLLLVGLALVGLGLIIPAFSRVFVDRVLINDGDWIMPLLLGLGLVAGLRGAATALQRHCLLRLEARLAVSTSSGFLWHVLRLPATFYAQRFAGDLSTRVGGNDRVAQLLAGPLASAALNLLLIAFYALLMYQYDHLLAGLAVTIALLNVLVLRYVARRRADGSQRLLVDESKLIQTTMNGLQTIETIKASGAERDFFARWAGHHARVLNGYQRLEAMTRSASTVPVLLAALNTAAILTLGGLQVMEGSLTIGTLIAFQCLVASFQAPVTELVTLAGTFQDVKGDMNRLDDVLGHPVDPLVVSSAGAPAPGAPVRLAGYLELRDVTFGYNRLEPPLIEGLNLSLRPGERVALVGGSGSGKSTVAKLVAGLYQPWAGQILFDGRPRADLPRDLLTRSLAIVDQDIALFDATIRENLTLWDESIPEADIVRAARDASIHDDVVNRPHGYDDPVDEDGRNFSGGQRQRLEIARALAGNPTVLVLDEATSALDAPTEQAIDEALRRRGCTCLIVAHRLSTIRDCDEIVVLERGTVVQRGTHDTLVGADGPYARLLYSERYEVDRSAASERS